ncbi:MAG: hypothetical protein GXX99_06920 [Clostridiales bacterium]|nr:hypothetical protein [Clostridiales bacterium]
MRESMNGSSLRPNSAAGYATVNLEEGRPLVDAAIKRATFHISRAKRQGLAALKFIHGYGSSGAGGRIRVELRAYLDRLVRRGEIRLYVAGEQFDIFDAGTQRLMSACREVAKDSDLNRHNNGITVVLL